MVHRSAVDGYDQHAGTYASVRPSYHPALVERFTTNFGGPTIVDLGAGTGIFTRQLIGAGLLPVAIEPVAAMREELQRMSPDARVLAGTAEETGLDSDSVDTVVVAQAFHWFDGAAALDEIARALRPGGHMVTVWNVRDEDVDWVGAFTEVVDRYAGDTPRYRSMAWRSAIEADSRFELVDEWSIPNPRPASPEAVGARALSTSFIAALDDTEQQTVLAEIAAITEPLGSSFDFPYRSELQAWRLGSVR